jgi:uncharacterized protein (TIGR03083 family)
VDDIPAIGRIEARELAIAENERALTLLRSLADDDWLKPTDCAGWDVRALSAHVLGGIESFCSYRSLARMMGKAKKEQGGGSFVDAMSSIQLRERAQLSTRELVDRLALAGPRSAVFRFKMPAPFRAMRIKQELLSGATEKWKIGYLLDVILTRDTWMHRVDIARATGRKMQLSAAHDGRIVADVVAEWARRHGRPFRLELTGPAGGTFVTRTDGELITLDAVEMCRILSGRAAGGGLLTQEVPF